MAVSPCFQVLARAQKSACGLTSRSQICAQFFVLIRGYEVRACGGGGFPAFPYGRFGAEIV